MPDFPFLSESVTSLALLPRLETSPSQSLRRVVSLEIIRRLEQAHPQIGGGVNFATIDTDRTVGDPHHQLALDYSLHFNFIVHQFAARQYLTSKLNFTRSQGTTFSRITTPSKEKPTSCHIASSQGIQASQDHPKWQSKNHRSLWISSSANMRPLPALRRRY